MITGLYNYLHNNDVILYYNVEQMRYGRDGMVPMTDLAISKRIPLFNITAHPDFQSDHRPVFFLTRNNKNYARQE